MSGADDVLEGDRFSLQCVLFDFVEKSRVTPEMDGSENPVQAVEGGVAVAPGADIILFHDVFDIVLAHFQRDVLAP